MPMSKTPDAEMNLRFAWAVLMLGYNQHDVAAIFGVNGGRVAEAVQAVRLAVGDPIKFTKIIESITQEKQVGRTSGFAGGGVQAAIGREGTDSQPQQGNRGDLLTHIGHAEDGKLD
jgi:hypothetical protein